MTWKKRSCRKCLLPEVGRPAGVGFRARADGGPLVGQELSTRARPPGWDPGPSPWPTILGTLLTYRRSPTFNCETDQWKATGSKSAHFQLSLGVISNRRRKVNTADKTRTGVNFDMKASRCDSNNTPCCCLTSPAHTTSARSPAKHSSP